jgi:hypothetical protein
MMAERTNIELRVLYLEDAVNQLRAALVSTNMLAAQAAQNASQTPSPVNTRTIFNCITTTAVTARVGTTMGSGTFNFVDSTGGTLTTLTAPGESTAFTDSSTGWASGKYGRVAHLDGIWHFLTADAC